LAQDGEPGQPGLETLQAELLEEAAVLGHRPTPFLVVIVLVVRQARLPPAATVAVGAEQQAVVGTRSHGRASFAQAPAAARSATRAIERRRSASHAETPQSSAMKMARPA